ncbi:MAG: hypothetical protein RSB58_08900 [Clostridium sp.]
MNKPTYYLWAHDFKTKEDMLTAKERFTSLGFRVVTLHGGTDDQNIQDGIKMLIKNHIHDSKGK